MGLDRLKTLRVGVSILFAALIAFLFLDLWDVVDPSVNRGLLFLQFVPSLLKFLRVTALGATGFIAVPILTVLFGRFYCSTLCPLGTLQDGIGFMARKKSRRRRPTRCSVIPFLP
jgi:polyferredoxin